ncbi:UNVERIFIED_CONTAM: Retrovirus-related Pol polyprotein from transposon TNT 1-94 [Sesamum indicum]
MAEPISVAIRITQKVDLTGLPDKFSGHFFKRWQQQMKIWLTMKGLLSVIQVIRPEPTDTDPKTAEIAQWTERDQIGRGAILSALSNTLFDVYCSDSYTAKSLWDEFDRKYNTEEQGLEKYSVFKFMRYQMVEDRSVGEQNHEIIDLEHALADAKMKLPKKFLVMSIVDKFSKSWENFGMTLKHQKGRLSLDDLMIAISIEEEHRNQTHKIASINKSKASKNKKPKANKPCWNCGQVGHWAKLCPNKKAKTRQAVVNKVVGGSSGASTLGATDGYVSVQPEILTIYEPYEWLIDTGANVHVCADKSLFVSYQAISGRTVSMGNSSTAEVLGIGSVDLKFPSRRILSLKRVHHVPTIRRNIISGSDEALDKFILFKNEAETQTGKKLKRLRSDRGGEYESSKFNEYCQTFGIIHEETPPYSPSSNGMAELKNRIFKDMINSLLLTSRLPKYLWGEALNTACHILNRVPLKHNTSTPFELWKGRKPSLKYFGVWGCLAKVLIPEHKRKKLGPKTVDAVFLGYVETSYALRFLVIKSEIPGIEVNTIVEFRDAVFLEDVFPLKIGIPSNVSLDDSLASTSISEHVEKMSNVGVSSSSSNQTHQVSDEPRRSKRARIIKDFGSDFVTYNIEDDPITFKDAMASSEAKQWKEAVKSEMDSIVSNGTWVLVDLPPGYKFKARSVAKGFKQKEGIDYFDIYSPVARLTTIRVLIALASVYNLTIHQMDVKTAFLYGELEEEIYMDQPEGL